MVVDDSVVIRGLLSRWLNEVPGIEVVSSQRTGLGALGDVEKSNPDVVLLDIEMPEMDGITALSLLLEKKKDLVVIMALTLTQRNAEISLKTLSLGAKDYVPKPEGNHGVTTSLDFRRDMIEKVKSLGEAARRRADSGRPPARAPRVDTAHVEPVRIEPVAPRAIALRPFSSVKPRILAIGSSTGGPQALNEVLKDISGAIANIPVVITQHMPPIFTAILAEHLSKASGHPAREGQHGETLEAGTIYVAPGGKHMSISSRDGRPVVQLDDSPPVNFCKPSVDPLFFSVMKAFGSAALAVVLTGMGADGAKGALAIADAGGSVIAQDEETSVVWGMPGATAAIGACAAVLPLPKVGPKIVSILGGRI